MAVQTVKALNPISDPYAVTPPTAYKEQGEQWDIDDDNWVAYHSGVTINNVEIVPP
jgi:hypothetical protein